MTQKNPKQLQPDESPNFVKLLETVKEAAQKESEAAKPADSLLKIDDEKKTLELERLQIENEGLRNKLERSHNLHGVRKVYVGLLFGLSVVWLLGVVGFVALTGFRVLGFILSDAVIIAFITSTTVSVLGLFILAAKWLFQSPADPDDKK